MDDERPPDPPDGGLNPPRPTSDDKTTIYEKPKMATSLLGQKDDHSARIHNYAK